MGGMIEIHGRARRGAAIRGFAGQPARPAALGRIALPALLGLLLLTWSGGAGAQSPEDDPGLARPEGTALRLSAGFSASLDTTRVGEHRMTFSKLTGVLFNAEAQPLLHEAALSCAAADDDGFVSGYCTATDAEGDALQLMIQHSGGPAMDDPADGEMLVLGGTGKFAGATGAASYMIEYEPITGEAEAKGRMAIDGTVTLR